MNCINCADARQVQTALCEPGKTALTAKSHSVSLELTFQIIPDLTEVLTVQVTLPLLFLCIFNLHKKSSERSFYIMAFPTSALFAGKSEKCQARDALFNNRSKEIRGRSMLCGCPQLLMRLVYPGGSANASPVSLASYRFCCRH